MENGAAEIRIVLEGGDITVYHSDGSILKIIKDAKEGSWSKIWAVLEGLT